MPSQRRLQLLRDLPDGAENRRWSAPVKPSFAQFWSNADPHFSPDSRTLFFISNRPGAGESSASEHYDIWSVSFESGHWGQPHRLAAPINSAAADEWSPSVTANGDLYFGSDRFDTPRNDASIAGIGNGKGDIYRIRMRELGLNAR